MTRLFLLAALSGLVAPAIAQVPDGPITRTQVQAAVRRQFAQMDTNHDGAVTRAEFDAYRTRTSRASTDDPFGHVGSHWFDRADASGNGRVTLAEAETRPMQLFDIADLDHDGTISPQERRMAEMLMGYKGR